MDLIAYLTDPLFVYQAMILLILLVFLGLLVVNLLTLPHADCEKAPANSLTAPHPTQPVIRSAAKDLRVPDAWSDPEILRCAPDDRDMSGDLADLPLVSILVPARNEAGNIAACVGSLLAQDYPQFEVLALDDQSEDGTGAILARLATQDGRLRVLTGGPVRPGWLGKANACRQLAEAARGDWLLFTDADTRHRPAALRCALALARRRRAGLLSIFPRQATPTRIERLVIPLMHLAVYGVLPLPAMRRLASPAFAAANGQFMLFTRAAYTAAGGHATVREQVLEDVGLARAVKRAGYPIELADGGDLVQTRMYTSAAALWAGFGKNFFAFFQYSLPFLIGGLGGLALLYVTPALWLLAGLARTAIIGVPSLREGWIWLGLPLLQYGCGVAMRLLLAARFRFHPADAVLHPLSVALQIAIGVYSARLARRGGGVWKGRSVRAMSDE